MEAQELRWWHVTAMKNRSAKPRHSQRSRQPDKMTAEPGDAERLLRKEDAPYYETLYNDALQYLGQGQTSLAIIVAQTTVELCTEATLEELLRVHGVDQIREPLTDLFKTYSITDDRLRRIFNALSCDEVQQSEFWGNLCALSKARNTIVHSGVNCPHDQAARLIRAVGDYIQYTRWVTEERKHDLDPQC